MGDAAPTVSGGNANPGEDTETADTAAAEDKVQVDTNDVSDQIVDKVASATSSDDDDNAELEPTEPEVDTDELSDDTDDTEKQDDSDNKDIDSQLDEDGYTVIRICNKTGYQLPSTGGPGTILYTFGGIAVLAIGLLYGFSMRRMRERRFR